MSYYLQLLLDGLIAGSVYAMFAVGLTMVYGVFGFINFAHGELIAWGAYLTLLFYKPPISLPLCLSVIPAMAVTALLGLGQDKLVFNPLRKSSRITLLIASIGLSYFLRNAIRLFWGSDLLSFGLEPTRGLVFFGLSVTFLQLIMILSAVSFLAFLYLLLTRTLLGKSLRAVSDNMELASIMGVSLKKVRVSVWALASIFAGFGGVLLAMDTNLEPTMGLTNLIKAFAAVLVGGAGNVWGALLGGLFIGIAENLSVAFFSPGYKDFISFAAIILVLLFRPRGLFAVAGGVR